DAGERVVAPALRALGVRRLDALVVSHGDADHAGGLAAVLRRFETGPVFAARDAGFEPAAPCLAGTQWEFDGVRFGFLHPHLHFPAMRNESSCVLRVESTQGSALLAGDIGAVVERMLVHDQAPLLRSDVVLAAHHGSDKSSDPAFAAATQARPAVASTGPGHRSCHPHPRVMQRWSDAGAGTADTARDGAVRIHISDGTHIERRRSSHPRLWDAVRRADAAR